MAFDPTADYPLGTRRPDLVGTTSGRPYVELTLDAARAGEVSADDLRATSDTLALQSQVARAAGRRQLADNLARAAELVGVSDTDLLEIYTALRPGRSTATEFEEAAARLDAAGAKLNAAFVREASGVYADRGLLRA
jgi:propanediol dehydratase small subunit